VVEEYEAFIHS